MNALAFGEVLWDIYPDNKYLGGAPLNYAAHFVSCGGDACIISAVGCDDLGAEAYAEIENLNINTEYLTRSEKLTGRCIVTLDENSVPTYELLEDTAYDRIIAPADGCEFDVLYFGTLALRGENNRTCIEKIIKNSKFGEIFVDINIRKPFISKSALDIALSNATILKISDEELPTLAELAELDNDSPKGAAKELCGKFSNIKLVIITLGGDGSSVYDRVTDTFEKCAARKVELVSTVGAGDSFSAAFTAKYLQNEPLSACMEFASRVSGYVVSQKGAIPDYDPRKLP